MILADKYMKESIKNILENGHMDVNPRPHYEDKVTLVDGIITDGNGKVISVKDDQWLEERDGEHVLCTPAHTISVNGVMHQYDISKGEFPITTLRPVAIKSGIGEILWIYQDASNDLNVLRDKYNVTWWDSWDIGDRTIGQCYGATVARHKLVEKLLAGIIKDPYGRRHIMNMWQEDDFNEKHGLKPCCYQTQFLVRGEYIDMIMYQRSSDWLTSGNINEMQYVALMMMVCRHCGYKPGVFTHFIANQQIYDRHVENAKIMLERTPIDCKPELILNPDKKDFWSFTVDDFKLVGYESVKPQLTFPIGI